MVVIRVLTAFGLNSITSNSSAMTTQFLLQHYVVPFIFFPCTDGTTSRKQMSRTTTTDGESLIVKIIRVESASITSITSKSSAMTTQFLLQHYVALYIFCPCTDSTKNQDQMMRTTWTDGESLIVKIQVESASIITSLGMDNINFE